MCGVRTCVHMKEGNVLFNNTIKTFYLRLYGIRHMMKDHSDSERENQLPPLHGLLFLISKAFFYAPSHRQDRTYHDLCYTSRGALTRTRNSSIGYRGIHISTCNLHEINEEGHCYDCLFK